MQATEPQAELISPEMIARLNSHCHCISVDMDALQKSINQNCAGSELKSDILADRPHLFAAPPVFLARSDVRAMQSAITAIESVIAHPGFQQKILADAPAVAQIDPGTLGVFHGYDFHITPDGPKLIEINTNAGGAMLNAELLRAATACCSEVETLTPTVASVEGLGQEFIRTFENEWQLQSGDRKLRNIAIVDEQPVQQYLYPEFLLFQQQFSRAGYHAIICDPSELEYHDGRLWHRDIEIDLVYNRLTDFYLAEPANAAIRTAWLDQSAVVTPHPRAHALYADKRNLSLLSDDAFFAELGINENTRAIIARAMPFTEIVTPDKAQRLWEKRKQLFFKPIHGFGSRGSYRGDKVTKRVWDDIIAGDYIAQALMPPSERSIGSLDGNNDMLIALKADFRNYVYDGKVLLLATRLYQGQTTNFRTPGGGFAPVFSETLTG